MTMKKLILELLNKAAVINQAEIGIAKDSKTTKHPLKGLKNEQLMDKPEGPESPYGDTPTQTADKFLKKHKKRFLI